MSDDRIWWREEPPNDDEQRKEVLACFGLAMYYAQCLEQQLRLMLVQYTPEILNEVPKHAEIFSHPIFKKTLGEIARQLCKEADLSKSLEDKLKKATELRNWLVHEYFIERIGDLLNSERHNDMIIDLQDKAKFLRELDGELTELFRKWLCQIGISRETVELELENFMNAGNHNRAKLN